MDDALSSKTHAWTCKQACKDAQKANGWHKQAWQAYHQAEWKKKKEGHAWSDLVPGDTFQMVTLKQGHMGVKRNHTTTDTLRVSNAAKPRTKEASTSIKHRSKQA